MHLTAYHLRVEYKENPLGIDRLRPRLGWRLQSGYRKDVQSAYRLIVSSSREALLGDSGDLWDTGKVPSDCSQHIEYEGAGLTSGQEVFWKVMVWDREGRPSPWSEPAVWSMGLLERSEWKGKWIGLKSPHAPTHAAPKPAVYLRKSLQVSKPVRRAVLYAAALGAYELYLNGSPIGNGSLNPDWTDYAIRLQYQAFDVTGQLAEGGNGLGVLLGHGWYSGYIGMFGYQRYGRDPRIMLQLNVEYQDGTVEKSYTDSTWKALFGPLVATDFQMGETYDARLAFPGWKEPAFNDAEWRQAEVFYDYKGFLCGAVCPPVKPVMELSPVSVERKETGTYVIDMGQNMVGRLRVRLSGEPGTTVILRHGEALDENGNLYTDNLRLTRQTDTYILNGEEEEWFEPFFTVHGFRYVELSGYPDVLSTEDVVGVVLHSSLPKTGTLETSHPLLNQLISNIEWTQRGNFVSVPTDCPQRDERHGWTGDALVFFRTACYQLESASFFTKWLTDLTDAQRPTGAFTDFAPFIPGGKTEHGGDMTYDHTASAGWADAGVLVPWMMYQVYGDKRILQEHYPSMIRWIRFLQEMHPRHIREDLPQYGDWLSIPETGGSPSCGTCPPCPRHRTTFSPPLIMLTPQECWPLWLKSSGVTRKRRSGPSSRRTSRRPT
ncbi:family 78 glycoside hydrolase catalytic domain [Paenibacillus sp. CC-CFT747]|nr:family 78 glycoside hydrolase catalytic domain [Paenibacillus sp. CC-CFT747]